MKRVIVIDRVKQRLDHEFFQEFADVEMATSYSNEEALQLHRSHRADLIITELYGSGMNTVQFCSLLREDAGARSVSIIVFRRDNDVEWQESARCRANAVLTLPVRRTTLRDAMQRLLNVAPRHSLRGAFSARQAGRPTSPAIDCRIEDISVSGMLIVTNAELREGDRLSFVLPIPAARAFSAQAEVVRTDRDRFSPTGGSWYGVRFSGLDPAAQKAIELVVHGSV